MKAIRTSLAEGVALTILPSQKFKTGLLSAQFVTPLRRSTASAHALIPWVLRRGTMTCPDMGRISERLDSLYGARVDATVRKIGERQCSGFMASFIDDRFTPGGERLLEPTAALLGELLCDPTTRNGKFVPAYFDSEKTNLVEAIRSAVNDKREWAARRLLESMCAGEPYGVPRLGTAEDAEGLKADALYESYREVLSGAPLEVVYCGGADPRRVEDAVRAALATLPRQNVKSLPPVRPHTPRQEVLQVEDAMDVTQGKLSMGFSCTSEDHTALLMGNALFGGTANSKLFLNVREKLSLCYYASSGFHRHKRLFTVASGIDFSNRQRAYDEILAQLEAVQKGEMEDWELEAGRASLLNAYASMGDSQGKLENFYLSQAVTGLNETPEELSEQVRNLTTERVIRAMETVRLDTVYFLHGKEAEA